MIAISNRSSTTTQKLQAFLGGAAATTNPTVTVVSYIVPPQAKPDYSEYRSAPQFTVLAGTTETDIADAPPEGSVKDICFISVYNADTAAVTVNVVVDDNGTNRFLIKATLATLETLYYESGRGWYVTTVAGAIKSSGGIGAIASSTDNAVVRWDGTGGTTVQNSLFVVDDTGHVTSFGGNITFPATQVASAGANTLDDYEEGTWTPAFTFDTPGNLSVAYSSRAGWYRKAGQLVGAGFRLATSTFTHTTASGSANITGWPFITNNISSIEYTGAMTWQGITKANYTDINLYAVGNSTATTLLACGSAQGLSFVAAADMPTAGTVNIIGQLTYPSSA